MIKFKKTVLAATLVGATALTMGSAQAWWGGGPWGGGPWGGGDRYGSRGWGEAGWLG